VKPLPHRYSVVIDLADLRHGRVTAPPRPELAVGYPPEFDGEDDVWSPEHLLLSAASSCFMTTFLAIAAASHVNVLQYRASAEGIVDRTPHGMAFTEIKLTVGVTAGAAERERIERLLEKAKAACIVANTLRVPVILDAAIEMREAA
jgi:organic hydroperoxide reductase OsmC/OhrA